MHKRTFFLLIVAMTLIVVSRAQAQDRFTIETVFDQFTELSDAVMTHSLESPTRQAMLQSGLENVFRQKKVRPPADLARQISDAGDADANRKILEESFAAKTITAGQRQVFLEGAARSSGATIAALQGLKVQRQLRDNLYVGIGIQLSLQGDVPTMPKVFPRGPARKAKAQDGDKILAVDGVETRGVALGEVVSMLRGTRGTDVRVRLQTGEQPPREVTMTRGIVPIDSVEGVERRVDDTWDFSLKENGEVAYLKVIELKGSTVSEIRDAARRIERGEFKALVLDLTRVTGGEFRHAVMLADLFIRGGALGHQASRTGDRKLTANAEAVLPEMPMVVLIGQATRGSAEWFAAALKDRERARLIGFRTMGDGSIRQEVDLESGFALSLKSGEMFRANGKPIQLPSAAATQTTLERTAQHYRSAQVGGVFPHTVVRNTLSNQISGALEALKPHLEKSLLQTSP